MRVISFRGMDINGKWHYGLLAESAGFPKQPEAGVYISNTAGFPWAFQVRIETVGQCTGLRDKNGMWIYEGDKHKWLGYEARDGKQIRPERTGVVIFDIEELFKLKNIIEGNKSLEIIGNIYEEVIPDGRLNQNDSSS